MRRFAALLWVGVFALGPGGEARAADAAWPMFRYDPARTARSPYEGTAGFGVSWTFAVPGGTESSISIGSDGSVYFGAYDNNFYALNSNGTLDWKFLTGNAVQSSPAIDSGGALLRRDRQPRLCAEPRRRPALVVRDRRSRLLLPRGARRCGLRRVDGQRRLRHLRVGSVGLLDVRHGRRRRVLPAVASDGTIYVGSKDGRLYALNSDGTLLWSYVAENSLRASPMVIEATSHVAIGCLDSDLYVFTSSGDLAWRYDWRPDQLLPGPVARRHHPHRVG